MFRAGQIYKLLVGGVRCLELSYPNLQDSDDDWETDPDHVNVMSEEQQRSCYHRCLHNQVDQSGHDIQLFKTHQQISGGVEQETQELLTWTNSGEFWQLLEFGVILAMREFTRIAV